MPRVAILTPEPGDNAHADLWRRVLARLQVALDAVGILATPTPWTDHVEEAAGLQPYDHVLPLLAWGYHHDHARWLRACACWEAAGIPLANPAEVLRWNSDKRYLARFAERGIAIADTTWTEVVDDALLATIFARTGAAELIVKPAVSGGAWKTLRVPRGASIEPLRGTPMLVQPYLPTIERDGETSLLYFGGHLSHAVNKRPVPGEFRVQEEFGGLYTLLPSPPDAARTLADQVLGAIGTPLLYARIDMVPDAQGRWLLMEAELIEPDFYLGIDPGGGARFAQALLARIRGRTPAA